MGQDKPLGRRHLGVVLRDLLPPAGPRELMPAAALVGLASLADRLGFDSLWVPEGRGRELMSTLGAMGHATSHIRLATGILPIYSRPPALAAMAAATLADLTGGRFILGVGAGHAAIVEAGYGLDYQEPLQAAREFVAIVRRALAGGPVTSRGRVFRVDGFQLESKPRHAVPIYMAALGPRMLRLAGQVADGVILNWCALPQVEQAAEAVRDAAVMAGREATAVTVAVFVRVAVTETPEFAWRVLRRLFVAYAAMPAYAQMFAAAGLEGEVFAVKAALEAGGMETAAATAAQEVMERFGVVGSADACRRDLEAYRRAGADLVIAYPFPVGADAAASIRGTIEGLAWA